MKPAWGGRDEMVMLFGRWRGRCHPQIEYGRPNTHFCLIYRASIL
jgi:hypothetical protein